MIDYSAQTVFNDPCAEGTNILGLQAPEIVRCARPGQFVMLKVRSGTDPILRRPFSICGVREDLVLLLYRQVGTGTALMTEIRPGQKIDLLGPLGQGFVLPKKNQTALLVGGGMGIAPLIFLALNLTKIDYKFLTGFRTRNEMILPDQLGFMNVPILSATDDGTAGHAGYVTELLEQTLAQVPAKDALVLYACGPLAMLKKTASLALSQGMACQVSLEAHMACGVGACQGCAVKVAATEEKPYLHVCKDGPVFPAQGIDWTIS